jgi:hypothetical protein
MMERFFFKIMNKVLTKRYKGDEKASPQYLIKKVLLIFYVQRRRGLKLRPRFVFLILNKLYNIALPIAIGCFDKINARRKGTHIHSKACLIVGFLLKYSLPD